MFVMTDPVFFTKKTTCSILNYSSSFVLLKCCKTLMNEEQITIYLFMVVYSYTDYSQSNTSIWVVQVKYKS